MLVDDCIVTARGSDDSIVFSWVFFVYLSVRCLSVNMITAMNSCTQFDEILHQTCFDNCKKPVESQVYRSKVKVTEPDFSILCRCCIRRGCYYLLPGRVDNYWPTPTFWLQISLPRTDLAFRKACQFNFILSFIAKLRSDNCCIKTLIWTLNSTSEKQRKLVCQFYFKKFRTSDCAVGQHIFS